ncbi:MAG: FadD3 family acyl-CoA ligase [Sphingomicrobium sp.]
MPTIPRLLSEAAARWKDKPALVAHDRTVSFAELDGRATEVARAFLAAGLQKGDRVALWAPNMWEWVAVAVGAQRVGGVLVPLNTRLRGGEVADVVRRSDTRFLVSVGNFLGRYYPDMLRDQRMPNLRKTIILRGAKNNDESFETFLGQAVEADDEVFATRAASITEYDIADIMFTSGTTGLPKGAMFDHRRSIGGGRAWQYISRLGAEDRYCCFGPFSHNASYKAGWVAGLLTGASIYWPEAYDAGSILSLIADNKITVMPAPPTVWLEAHAHPNRADWDTSSLRYLSTGSTTVPIELMRRLKRDMNIPVISTGYGMTECAGSATHTRDDDDIERLFHTVGCPLPGTEIKIVGPDGHELPVGEAGEVLIRDDKLLIEYLDNPDATRSTLDLDGWLHSGDVGAMTPDGYLRITDRMKDMYIVGGFNVYPAEIERQMSQLPGLHYCSIVGVPDQRLGEVGHAFVVRAAGSCLTEAEVIAWSKQNLANYKVPRGVTFIDELPMNASGKVLKFKLKELV